MENANRLLLHSVLIRSTEIPLVSPDQVCSDYSITYHPSVDTCTPHLHVGRGGEEGRGGGRGGGEGRRGVQTGSSVTADASYLAQHGHSP